MGHTTPPLRVGFDGVNGYAEPDEFEIDHHEKVEVLAAKLPGASEFSFSATAT